MKKFITYLYYNISDRFRKALMPASWKSSYGGVTGNAKLLSYAGHEMLNTVSFHEKLCNSVMGGHPFMAARFGTVELSVMKVFEFNRKSVLGGNVYAL